MGGGGGVQATLNAYHQNKLGSRKFTPGDFSFKTTKKLSAGDDLALVTRNNSYQGYVIEEIVAGGLFDSQPYVKFRNGFTLYEGQRATDYKTIFDLQLYYLIKEHFEKKEKLEKLGIKCLSLIFIDRVDNYVASNGVIKTLFEKNYLKAYKEKYGQTCSAEQLKNCQGSYFATTTKGDYTDNERSMVNNKTLYDLILKDKERLLNLNNLVEFIFSHSALGVGWDNPNVFNIATLNQSQSEISKRQRLGRGLRICVNQAGKRIYDSAETPEDSLINELTVVPNESYETFASDYQTEVGGKKIDLRDKPRGKDKYGRLIRNDRLYNQPSFDDFWEKISQKTEYFASFDEGKLIEKAVSELNTIYLAAPRIEVEKRGLSYAQNLLDMPEDEVRSKYRGSARHQYNPYFAPLDIVDEISQQTALTRRFILSVITRSDNKAQIIKNPPAFVQQAVQKLKSLLVREGMEGEGLRYKPVNEYYDKAEFKKVVKTVSAPEKLASTKQKGIYDHIVCDSDIENSFVQTVAEAGEIDLFLKFPAFYKIKTPAGNYNPDFGIVLLKSNIYSHDNLFFVVETKGTDNIDDMNALTLSESHKMHYAHKHFEALGFSVKYIAPVNSYSKFKEEVEQCRI